MPELSTEQQFQLQVFELQVSDLNEKECKKKIVEIYKQMLEMDNNYKALLKHQWGL